MPSLLGEMNATIQQHNAVTWLQVIGIPGGSELKLTLVTARPADELRDVVCTSVLPVVERHGYRPTVMWITNSQLTIRPDECAVVAVGHQNDRRGG